MTHRVFSIRFICGVLSAVAVLCFISPQFIYAHGLRSVLPLMAVTVVLAAFARKRIFAAAIVRSRIILVCGALFVAQALIRFYGVSEAGMVSRDILNVYATSATISLFMLFWVFMISELGGIAALNLQRLVLFGWGLSLSLGIPTLISTPFVARLTMSTPDALDNAFVYAPHGIGNYLHYTPFAITLLPMMIFASRLRGIGRLTAFALLAGGAVAVFLSTFTMAVTLLMCSIGLSLGAFALFGRGNPVIRFLAIGVLVAGIGYTAYIFSDSFQQASFVIEKFERLMSGFASSGVAQGDETGRGAWFAAEMHYFFDQNPFFGYVRGSTDYVAKGHSSLADTLVLFGVGGVLWAVVLGSLIRQSWRSASSALERYAVTGSYLMFAASGILNPTWYFPEFIIPLAVFTVGGPLPRDAMSAVELQNPVPEYSAREGAA